MSIHFHDDFYFCIKEGKKIQTVRFKEKESSLGISKAIFDNNEDIAIIITAIKEKPFNQLSIEEVLKDGFYSKEELWNTLLRFYPGLNDNDILSLIEFKCI